MSLACLVLRRLGAAAVLWFALACRAAAPDAAALAALHAERPVTTAQAMRYADVLDRTEQPVAAQALRGALLSAHLDALEGRPAAARSIGEWLAEGAALDLSRYGPLASRWAAAAQRGIALRWVASPPAGLGGPSAPLQPLGPGAWSLGRGDGLQLVAAIELSNRLPDTITLPALQLRAGPVAGGVALTCQPADADPPDRPLASGATRAFACRGPAAAAGAAGAEMLARASRGRAAPGERLQWEPAHFARAGGLAALTAAIASSSPPIDADGWVTRLRAAPAAAARATSAPPAATKPVAPPRAAAAATAPGPAPAPAWRTTMAIAGAAAALLLLVRLVYGRLADVSPARTVVRSLPAVLGLFALAAAIGSPTGQDLLNHATGRGLRDAALALQAASDASPQAARLDELWLRLWKRWGFFGVAIVLGGALFMLERGLQQLSLGRPLVLVLSLLARVVAIAPFAAASGAGGTVGVAFALVAAAVFGVSFAVTLALHRAASVLDDEGLSWPDTVRRGMAGTLDWRGTATQAEFWGFLAFALLAWGTARAAFPPWDAAVALLLAPPLLALTVRRWRALSARSLWGMAALLLLGVLELASR